MPLTLELGAIHDPATRRAFEQIILQVPGLVTTTGGGGGPSGPAGGVLGGTYPNPGFAADMATQAELDAHTTLTTTAHGGIVASTDTRLTDARTPTAHHATHEPGGTDAMAVDAVAGTGSLRTLGTGATSAAAGNRGLPTGGTTGQVLAKNSAADYDAGWAAGGGGGSAVGMFSAYRNAALSVATGAVITFDTEEFDISGWHNVTDGRFTPLTAGVYRLSWRVSFSAAVTADVYIRADLRKNGTAFKFGQAGYQRGATLPVNSGGTAIVQANGTTDFYDVTVAHGTGASTALRVGVDGTFFQGEGVG